MSALVETSFTTVCGRRLEYQRLSGARRGAPTIVFLHEGLGSVSMWRDFPQRVAESTGCPVIVYSRYGYGQSEVPKAPFAVRYMHDEGLYALPELLERLGVEQPVLFGHSDGGPISIIPAATLSFEPTDLPKKLARHHADAEKSFRRWNDIWLHPDFRRWNIEE